MKKISKIIVAILAAVVCGVGGIAGVYADNVGTSSLTFGPTSQRVSLKPGEKYRSSVIVSNPATSARDTKFMLYVSPYMVTNDDYDPAFDQMGTYTQIADWITLDRTEGSLAPNTNMEIGFTINVPGDAPAGGQYAAIVAQDTTDLGGDNEGELQIASIGAVGSIVVADIAGQTREYGEIIENSMPSIVLNPPFTASAGVKNTGNVHTDASSILQIWPLFSDEEVYTNEENEDNSKLVLPDTTRYFFNTWTDAPAIGVFRARQTVTIFGETSVNEKIIVQCPLWLLFIIIFFVALILIWCVTMIVKSVRKHKIKKVKAE